MLIELGIGMGLSGANHHPLAAGRDVDLSPQGTKGHDQIGGSGGDERGLDPGCRLTNAQVVGRPVEPPEAALGRIERTAREQCRQLGF